MAGMVAAGNPIEPIPQSELVEVPPSMIRTGENVARRVKGEAMRDESVLLGNLVIVHKQEPARNGQTVVALVNQEAPIKEDSRQAGRIEWHPGHATMTPLLVTAADESPLQQVVRRRNQETEDASSRRG